MESPPHTLGNEPTAYSPPLWVPLRFSVVRSSRTRRNRSVLYVRRKKHEPCLFLRHCYWKHCYWHHCSENHWDHTSGNLPKGAVLPMMRSLQLMKSPWVVSLRSLQFFVEGSAQESTPSPAVSKKGEGCIHGNQYFSYCSDSDGGSDRTGCNGRDVANGGIVVGYIKIAVPQLHPS